MSQKLSTITPTYFSFTKDQLLTHTDLNQVINYFEDQDRLSRICLNGVGIVCGFKPYFDENNNTLSISQGTGVTTDGDLLHFLFNVDNENSIVSDENKPSDEKFFDFLKLTKYRDFTDSNANYPQFQNPNISGSPIPMWELLPATSDAPNTLNPGFFDGKIIVLYLDCYSKEPGACTAISCDSQGIEEVRVLRVLAVNEENETGDIGDVNRFDYLFNAGNVADDYLAMGDAALQRVVINTSNATTVSTLQTAYKDAIINSGTVTAMTNGLELMGNRIGLDGGVISALQSSIQTLLNAGAIPTTLFQYKYDLLKDLLSCYNELKDLFVKDFPTCCPDLYPFPKHLVLGKIKLLEDGETVQTAEDLFIENNEYRHSFYGSPILTQRYSSRDHMVKLFEKMQLLCDSYSVTNATNEDQIKITPSKMHRYSGDKAIPFYYLPSYQAGNNSRLVRLWDYKRRTIRQYDSILGYHQSTVSTFPSVADPLLHLLDDYDFFRIEGLQGLPYQNALDRIKTIRDQNGLSFDVKAVGVSVDGTQEIDLTEYGCEFADIEGQYDSCLDEVSCILSFASQLISGYTTENDSKGDNHNMEELMGYNNVPISRPTILATQEYQAEQQFRSAPQTEAEYSTDSATATRSASYQEQNYTNTSTSNTAESSEAQVYQQAQDQQNELDQAVDDNGEIDVSGFTNPILKNLYVDISPAGLGRIFYDAFTTNIGIDSTITYALIKNDLDVLTSAAANGPLSGWSPVLKQAHLYIPSKIIAVGYAITQLMPQDISLLTNTILTNIEIEAETLCFEVRKYENEYKKLATDVEAANVQEELFSLVNILNSNLSTLCCLAEKLQSLLDQIEDRKLEILAGLELSKFAEKHPGMEHFAGVPDGGTFIMAYAFNENGNGAVQDGTIIADFAVPYLCCSDCRPVDIIVQKDVVTLLLEKSIACLPDGQLSPYSVGYTVSPAGAAVDVSPAVTGVSIDDANNAIVIDPLTFTQFNTPIGFTVNAQYTSASLIVVQPQTISIQITPDIDFNKPTSLNQFNFYSIGHSPGDQFFWDFGDGSSASGVNLTQVQHTYNLPVTNDKANIILTVTPSNGSCPSTANRSILFEPLKVLIETDKVCSNGDPVPITFTPTAADPGLSGAGIVQGANDQYFFDPKIAGEGVHPLFTYQNKFVDVTVEPGPDVRITEAITAESDLFLKGEVKNALNFYWAFFDADNPELELAQPARIPNASEITIKYDEFGTTDRTIIARLIAEPLESEICRDSSVAEITFEVRL